MRLAYLALLGVFLTVACKTQDVVPHPTEPVSRPAAEDKAAPASTPAHAYEARLVPRFSPAIQDALAVCTWNIQWIGHWKAKKNEDLARALADCDIAVIQEMVAPPWDVNVASAEGPLVLKGDEQAKAFTDAMQGVGFDGVELSTEDTGPTKNHTNTTASEWYVLFYKKAKVSIAKDLPMGFLARKLAGNSVYSRVPYAFGLRAQRNGKPSVDFVLVSVHLHAKGSDESLTRSKAIRVREFRTINQWITRQRLKHGSKEQDFFVVGDMNIEDLDEVMAFFGKPAPWVDTELASVPATPTDLEPTVPEASTTLQKVQSMNYSERSQTMRGTNLQRTKPFDHVMHHRDITVRTDPVLEIFDMQTMFKLDSFPTARDFVQAYSDHSPLRFLIYLDEDRD